MKNKLQRLTELEKETREIRSEFQQRVEIIAARVLAATHGLAFYVREPASHWEVNDGSINFEWEDWQSGDHDRGYGSFPIELLWDNDAVVEWEIAIARRKEIELERERQRKAQQAELQERAQYELLKAKFELKPEAQQ